MANEPGTTAYTPTVVNETNGEYTCPFCHKSQVLSKTYVLLDSGAGYEKCPGCKRYVFVKVPPKQK
jgi:transcription elongation factor Elf1